MNTQSTTIKTKLPSVKPPRCDSSKTSAFSAFENFQEWTDKRSCDDSTKASEDERDSERPSIFREMADFDDSEDMMSLKRANPVYDNDDDEYLAISSKRQRTSSTENVLTWSAQLSEDSEDGFCIRLQH
jgi:hypothetical protein